MKRLITLTTFVLAFCYSFAQTPFYIQKGNVISKIENTNPSQIKAKEWQVRLYKKGVAKTGNSYWGTIKGKTSREVMTKLKSDQDFELRFNAFLGKGKVQDDVFTNFNPLGPIAIMDESSIEESPNKENSEKLSELTGIAKEYFATYSEVKKKLDVILEGKPTTAFDNVGNIFREYTSNLKDAFLQINSLRKMLENNISVSIAKINKEIEEINAKLEATTNYKNRIETKIDNNKTTNSVAKQNEENGNVFFIFLSADIVVKGKSLTIISTPIQHNGKLTDDMKPYKKDFIEKIEKQIIDKPNNLKQNFERDDYETISIHYSKPFSTTLLKSETESLNAITAFKQSLKDAVEGLPNVDSINFFQLK